MTLNEVEKNDDIRFEICENCHVKELVSFIENHWKNGHIFTKSQILLDWQHKYINSNYNFVIAKQNVTQSIVGILGFIPTHQFSNMLLSHNEAWLAIWKVRSDISKPGIVIFMLKFLEKKYQLQSIAVAGLSEMVVPIYKALGFQIGKLSQSILINNSKTRFSILKINTPLKTIQPIINHDYSLKILTKADLEKFSEKLEEKIFSSRPRKNIQYLINRYYKHPIYNYKLYGVFEKIELHAIVVTRESEANNCKVLRIVDYQGEWESLQFLNAALQQLLKETDCEYVDFMQHGIPTEFLAKSGFLLITEGHDDLIAPNYFEPFEQCNITIDYAYRTKYDDKKFTIFKGDCDQDRPNLI